MLYNVKESKALKETLMDTFFEQIVKVKKTGKGATMSEDERVIVKSTGSFDMKI